MSSKPWIAWYPADYSAKTGHLTFEEDSAYRRLLDHCYSSGKALPNDDARLLRIAKAHADTEITAVMAVKNEFFVLGSDGLLHNKRVDKELVRQKDFIEEQARKGRLSAQARWGNRNNRGVTEDITEAVTEFQPNGNLPQLQPHSHITATSTVTENQNQEKSKTKPRLNGKARKTSLPAHLEALQPSDRLKAWCEKNDERQIKAHLVYFVGYVKANGKQYVDWDQAVINAVRDDWAGIRKAGL